MATSSSSVTTPTFSGNSTYASDLQSAITRAVAIASLPVTSLQNKTNDLTSQVSALGSLNQQFQSLSSAVSSLETAATSGSLAAQVGDNTVLTASVGSGVKAGTYNVNVASIGSQTNSISADSLTKVTDPTSGNIDTAANLTLAVNGTNYNISNAGGNLNALATAINSSGAGVTATVINIGGSTSPDYRLSILSNRYAPDTIQLTDSSSTSLLNTLSAGTYVTYQINGQPSTPITSTSRSISFAAGLTINALKVGSTSVNVVTSGSSLSSAISNFATAYNNTFDELAKSRGQNGGALAGQSIVSTMSQALQGLYSAGTPSGKVSSLSDLGLSYDQNGHLNFDSSTFNSILSSNASDVLNFLGSSTSGYLQQADSSLKSIDDPTTGLLQTTATNLGSEITSTNTKIQDLQSRISLMQTNLTKQMVKADALISQFQSQSSYYTSLFAQMRANQTSGY